MHGVVLLNVQPLPAAADESACVLQQLSKDTWQYSELLCFGRECNQQWLLTCTVQSMLSRGEGRHLDRSKLDTL